jgi:hypothetical protein
MFANAKKIILCANNTSLTAGLWYGTKLQTYAVFKNNDDDYTAFSEYLSQHTDTNVYLLVDAVEEDYKLESLPHTAGKARQEIIERKQNQFNRNSTYRAAHFVNRATDKRKDDNFLFLALSNDDFLQGWMNVIKANHAPLVGVYLLSMMSQGIVRQMKLMAPNILLCERLPSGLRQSFLYNGRLRMSRLAQMNDVKPSQLAYFYLVEIEKTRLYLLSQRLIAADTPLQMVLPSLDKSHHEIAKSISQDQGVECKTVDILTYAKNNNISPDLVKTNPDLLHMQLLANGNIPDNLAPASYSRIHSLNNLRRNIHIATGVLATTGVLFAGYNLWQGTLQKDQIQLVTQQTQQQLQQYEQVAKNFPATPIASQELKVAVDLAQTINSYRQTPVQLMQITSKALEQTPEITLNRIRWMLTADKEIKDEEGDIGGVIAATAIAPNTSGEPAKLLQVGFINAEIKGFTGDYRAALGSVNNFANHLRENNLVENVVVLQEPVNVSSLANLQGSTTDENTNERPPAIFKLKVVLKPEAAPVALSASAEPAMERLQP